MIVLVNQHLVPKGFNGIVLWPVVILRKAAFKQDARMVNHESIHLRQQAELLVVFFYVWYGVEYLFRWMIYGNRYKAYRNISFEREAYTHENDKNYLKSRPLWNFRKFI